MKIQLTITPAVIEYAKKYGALYEKEIGWYCFAPVPLELDEFITAPIVRRKEINYAQCPKCGGQMQLKTTKKDVTFWSCMMFPKCRGSLSVDKAAEQSTVHISKITTENISELKKKSEINFSALAALGIKQFNNVKQFEKWLNSPKIALNGETPIQVLHNGQGLEQVLTLLSQINN